MVDLLVIDIFMLYSFISLLVQSYLLRMYCSVVTVSKGGGVLAVKLARVLQHYFGKEVMVKSIVFRLEQLPEES